MADTLGMLEDWQTLQGDPDLVTNARVEYASRTPRPQGARTQPDPDTNSVGVIPLAKRFAVRSAEKSPTGGVYLGAEVDYIAFVALLAPGTTFAPGDLVFDPDDGNVYTVIRAQLQRDRADWKLSCLSLAIAHNLNDTVNVERPALSRDAAGNLVKAFPTQSHPSDMVGGTTVYPGLACRVQLDRKEVKEERGIKALEERYEIHVARQLVVTLEDRVFWPAFNNGVGCYLDVAGYRDAERIEEVPVIEAVRRV